LILSSFLLQDFANLLQRYCKAVAVVLQTNMQCGCKQYAVVLQTNMQCGCKQYAVMLQTVCSSTAKRMQQVCS